MKGDAIRQLLFISPVYPFPVKTGQQVRVSKLIEACARGFEVTYLGPGPTDAEGPEFSTPFKRVLFVEGNGVVSPSALARMLLGGYIGPPGLLRLWRSYLDAMRSLNLEEFDLIFVERGHLAALAKGHTRKTVVDFDDVEHRKAVREARHVLTGGARLHALQRALRLSVREIVQAFRYRKVFVCSDDDCNYLLRFGLKNVGIIRNGVDLDGEWAPGEERGRKKALFLGNLDYPPNVDALEYLVHDILPLVHRRMPDFIVDVIGGGTAPATLRTKRGLNFIGYVPDLRAVLPSYQVMAAPLRLGGGTKLKLLDAMAAMLPISTTPVGAEGLELVDGETALISANPKDIADDIVRLCNDPDYGASLARGAYALAAAKFQWVQIQDDLAKVLDSICAPSGNSQAS
ncbi:MAG: glycosyltransferase [Beijerinckiaceae bacterium]|nr:glycosyltransferase [Beijerinckiaceae bacterium]